MPRTPNRIGTVPLKLSTTRPIIRALEQLVFTGLYGKNPSEAAERLIARGIEQLLKEGALPKDGLADASSAHTGQK